MRHSNSPRWLAGAVVFLLGMWIAVTPPSVLAHAVLVSSTPQKNAAVTGPDIVINLKYNSRIDGAHSTLSLLKPDGTVEKIDAPSQPAPDVLSAAGHGLTKGSYVLRWQVMASDGHITRGEVPFQVQ
jgi:copper resistance protein C